MASLPGCKSSGPEDPAAIFQTVRIEFLKGDLVRARADAERAYARFSKIEEWECQFRLLQAEILVNQGRMKEALSLLSLSLTPTPSNGNLVIKKHILQAIAYARLGRLDQSETELTQAANLADTQKSDLDGEVARAQGVVAIIRENLKDADRFFRSSLRIARQREDHFLELTALLNLGVVAMKEEHHDEAIDWTNRANVMAKELGARFTEEKVLGNLGLEYFYMGDFDRALELSLEARRLAHDLDAEYDEGQWLDQIGLIHFQADEWQVAEDFYKQSLALARKISNREEIAETLTTLALVSIKRGALQEAEQFSLQATEVAQGDHPSEISASLVRALVAEERGEISAGTQRLLTAARDPQSDASQRWEAEQSLGHLYERQNQPRDADRHYRAALAVFESARSSLQREETRLPFRTNALHLYDDYVQFLVAQGKSREALERADFSRAQTLTEGLGIEAKNSAGSALSPEQIAARAKATILFYWLGAQKSYLWIVTDHTSRIFELPAAPEIDDLVSKYNQALVGPRDPIQINDADGARLYDVLVAPARDLVPPGGRVIVIPDGNLNKLNFETLLVSAPTPHYWIEDVTVSVASSLRLLAHAQAGSHAGNDSLLLLGDAVAASPDYPALPNAGAEIQSIQKNFKLSDERVFTGDRATPSAYLENKPELSSYIHFVAHGTASQLRPLESAIVLSKDTAEEESFKLYARDIVRHRLAAELVTISSCYGAGVRAYTGEGVVGLSWAFLRAGAHNVIGALWEVSDASTPVLMDQLYGELRNGRSPDAALRAAKLSLLHSAGVFRKPYYWAPFQLYTGA